MDEDELETGADEDEDEKPQGDEPEGAGEELERTAEGGGEKAKPKGKDDLRDLRKQLQGQATEIKRLQTSERYWAEKAAARASGDEPVVDGDQDDDAGEYDDLLAEGDEGGGEGKDEADDPEKFIDELTSQGPKALDKVIAKRGYVRKEDVIKLASEVAKRSIAKERGKITIDARLASEFGDLKDEDSPLWKETSKIFREMVGLDPKLARSPAAVLLAAKAGRGILAEAQARNGKRRTSDEGEDTRRQAERDEERDSERKRRIGAQMGDTGRGRSRDDDMEDDMGPEARYLATTWARNARMKPEELLGAVRDDRRRARRR